ncbi:MAG TPA: outer membrane beta-barrel protein [Candidatus Mcinerneyibacteriales bacterium]|nr:outer membrane beta-barrel protein [Candidatus Mcinerneyibacteriales bacterium]
MKKMLMIVVLMVLAVSMVSATQFGVKAGLVMSKFTEDFEGVEPGVNTGLLFGAMIHMPLPALPLTIIGEANYIQKGSKFEESGDELFFNTNFIELTALAKYNILPMVGIYAGPSWAFTATAEVEFNGVTVDFKDEIKGSEMSLNIGAQGKLGPILLDGRYNMGLTDMNDVSEWDQNLKTSSFIISAGILF